MHIYNSVNFRVKPFQFTWKNTDIVYSSSNFTDIELQFDIIAEIHSQQIAWDHE